MPNDDLLLLALDAVTGANDASVDRIAALEALRSLSETTLHAEVTQARSVVSHGRLSGRPSASPGRRPFRTVN